LDGGYVLAPIDPQTEEARQRMRQTEPPRTALVVSEPETSHWQFSLGQLILANTLLAVTLAMLQIMAPSYIAGALGLVSFAFFLLVWVYQPARPAIYAVCWGLIVLYLFVAGIALWRG
jgi:hypothetical protein